MTLLISPNQTFAYVLAADARQPRSGTARFLLKALTKAQAAEIKAAVKYDPDKKISNQQWTQTVYSAAAGVMAGWSNVAAADGVALKFSADAIAVALTLDEAWEIVCHALSVAEPSEDDLKNSV